MRAAPQLILGFLILLLMDSQGRAQNVDDLITSYRESFMHGDFAAAMKDVQRAMAAEIQASGDHSSALPSIQRDFAIILAANQHYAEAADQLLTLQRQAEEQGAAVLAEAFALDLSDVYAELGQRDKAREMFDKAMKIEQGLNSTVITRGNAGASAASINTRAARYHQSAWDLFSKAGAEIGGYGRYSYILYWTQPIANDSFLVELFGRVSTTSRVEESKGDLNIFYIPVRTEIVQGLRTRAIVAGEAQPQLPTPTIAAAYDVELARSLLSQFCRLLKGSEQTPPTMCRSGSPSDGPYVLVTSSPWSGHGNPGFEAVLLDLSGHEQIVQPVAIRALLSVVHSEKPEGLDRLTTTRLQVADALVEAGGIAQAVVDKMVQLVKLRLN